MSTQTIEISNLYKIFGPRSKKMLTRIKSGMDKTEILDNYNHVVGLSNINLSILEKEITVIMGLSGSGKSTLIRHINRLIEPTAGEISVFGQDVLAMSRKELIHLRRHQISMVFQKFGLHPHKTVLQNIAYGLGVQKLDKNYINTQANYWLEKVGLEGFGDHYPAQLSGGMQQRVGLARALATDSPILLMDEAFSALDPLIKTEMQDLLLQLQEELHKTIIFITHDLDEALRIGNTIVVLKNGEVVQTGNPQDIILHPCDEYVTNFVKNINRAKIVQVASIMQNKILKDTHHIEATLTLEEAAKQLVHLPKQQANIINSQGQPQGSIHLEEIIDTM